MDVSLAVGEVFAKRLVGELGHLHPLGGLYHDGEYQVLSLAMNAPSSHGAHKAPACLDLTLIHSLSTGAMPGRTCRLPLISRDAVQIQGADRSRSSTRSSSAPVV